MTPRQGAVVLPIRVSMDDPEPMYLQIQRQLRGLVVGGYLSAGTQLPSVRQLAHDLSCSVITTRRAYQELEREGIIRTRQGMGTVVAELAAEEVALHRREPVARAFSEAVSEGRKAGMNDEELRELFLEALRTQRTDTGRGTIRT
jgi:GntR family transcriptional regulator